MISIFVEKKDNAGKRDNRSFTAHSRLGIHQRNLFDAPCPSPVPCLLGEISVNEIAWPRRQFVAALFSSILFSKSYSSWSPTLAAAG